MIQLRVRSEYSFGGTFAPIKRIVDRLKEQGCTAAAIVDNASSWGHVKFFEACKEAGIQPMLGLELCVSDDENTTSMWFIAKNKTGLSELYRASSKAYRNPLATKVGKIPRLYKDDVREMSDDIIKFAGEITDGEFLKSIGAYIDLNPASRVLNMRKQQIAKEKGIEIVTTSDNAFAFEEDKETFELVSHQKMGYWPES